MRPTEEARKLHFDSFYERALLHGRSSAWARKAPWDESFLWHQSITTALPTRVVLFSLSHIPLVPPLSALYLLCQAFFFSLFLVLPLYFVRRGPDRNRTVCVYETRWRKRKYWLFYLLLPLFLYDWFACKTTPVVVWWPWLHSSHLFDLSDDIPHSLSSLILLMGQCVFLVYIRCFSFPSIRPCYAPIVGFFTDESEV